MVAAGDKVTATDISDIEDATTGKPLVRLIQQSAQSMTSGSAAAITFGASSEDIDTHGFHDTASNTSRITPTVAGYYRLSGAFKIVSGSAVTQILIAFRKNGSNVSTLLPQRPDAASNGGMGIHLSIIQTANGTSDYFELVGQQNSGGAINTDVTANQQCVFECEFLRPL